MINKLKFLTAYFNRAIVPAPGATKGEIIYTSKNITGRRKQYVIDLDNNTISKQSINAHPANPLTQPGKIVELTLVNPKTDLMYAYKLASLPTIINDTNLDVDIAPNGTININLFHAAKINGIVATTTTAVINVIDDNNGLSVNTTTGVLSVDTISAEGVYTIEYTISDKNEPSVVTNNIITTVTIA